jgi:hypothetical protein
VHAAILPHPVWLLPSGITKLVRRRLVSVIFADNSEQLRLA